MWLRTILIVRKETCCRHIGYSYRLTARVLLYALSHRQDNTYHSLCYTSRGALAGTRNSSMGPPHEGSIRWPIAPWANALPLSYVPLSSNKVSNNKNLQVVLQFLSLDELETLEEVEREQGVRANHLDVLAHLLDLTQALLQLHANVAWNKGTSHYKQDNTNTTLNKGHIIHVQSQYCMDQRSKSCINQITSILFG